LIASHVEEFSLGSIARRTHEMVKSHRPSAIFLQKIVDELLRMDKNHAPQCGGWLNPALASETARQSFLQIAVDASEH
jgi:hypothetical protein